MAQHIFMFTLLVQIILRLTKNSVAFYKNSVSIYNMKITKHTTVTLTIDEIKKSLADYQSEIMSEMIIEKFGYFRLDRGFDSNRSVCGHKLLEWSNLLLKGTFSEEFKKLNDGRWIHTPSFFSQFVELIESFPHMFLDTSLFDGLDAKDFSVKIVHDNGDEAIVDSQKILSNI